MRAFFNKLPVGKLEEDDGTAMFFLFQKKQKICKNCFYIY